MATGHCPPSARLLRALPTLSRTRAKDVHRSAAQRRVRGRDQGKGGRGDQGINASIWNGEGGGSGNATFLGLFPPSPSKTDRVPGSASVSLSVESSLSPPLARSLACSALLRVSLRLCVFCVECAPIFVCSSHPASGSHLIPSHTHRPGSSIALPPSAISRAYSSSLLSLYRANSLAPPFSPLPPLPPPPHSLPPEATRVDARPHPHTSSLLL
ncbi:hypothetical protein OH77DRAFT_356274 [Trametes cingulata]|nr:hypothetical protein OH77DRAFT_356274 [Trametes cingulata]